LRGLLNSALRDAVTRLATTVKRAASKAHLPMGE
jgi:hypothetical protein